jgi:hypothetical protein
VRKNAVDVWRPRLGALRHGHSGDGRIPLPRGPQNAPASIQSSEPRIVSKNYVGSTRDLPGGIATARHRAPGPACDRVWCRCRHHPNIDCCPLTPGAVIATGWFCGADATPRVVIDLTFGTHRIGLESTQSGPLVPSHRFERCLPLNRPCHRLGAMARLGRKFDRRLPDRDAPVREFADRRALAK